MIIEKVYQDNKINVMAIKHNIEDFQNSYYQNCTVLIVGECITKAILSPYDESILATCGFEEEKFQDIIRWIVSSYYALEISEIADFSAI